MSKDQTIQQTLFQEDSHANLSPLQEKEREKRMIATSGQKCYELLPKSNQDGLLGKMCKALLTSTTAWYSDRCKLIWKHKVSKSNVSLFQLQASVLGTKETESGSLLPTPRARDYFGSVNPNQVSMNSTGWTTTRKGTGVKYGASLPDVVNKIAGGKGRLNPNFVEFLMGYAQNFTKIEPTE